jgi:cytochrome c oxidase assembly protein subunit 15
MQLGLLSSKERWLHRYGVALAAATLLLIVAGALVTSNEAGLSVPDWPLSYGKVMPEMKGGVFYEHGHRMVATAVGMLTIGLVVFLHRAEKRVWMKRLGWAALGAVIAQGVLGGLTVIYLLPKAISIFHACLAQLFFATTCAIAVFTSPGWKAGPEIVEDHKWPSLRSLAAVTSALLLLQILLGAAFRHRALGVLPHVLFAFVVAGVVTMLALFTLTQFPKHAALRKAAHALVGVTFVQVLLGLGALLARMREVPNPAEIVSTTVVHVAMGALTLGASVVFTLQIFYHVRRKPVPAEAPEAALSR